MQLSQVHVARLHSQHAWQLTVQYLQDPYERTYQIDRQINQASHIHRISW